MKRILIIAVLALVVSCSTDVFSPFGKTVSPPAWLYGFWASSDSNTSYTVTSRAVIGNSFNSEEYRQVQVIELENSADTYSLNAETMYITFKKDYLISAINSNSYVITNGTNISTNVYYDTNYLKRVSYSEQGGTPLYLFYQSN